jgi:hypothetical protein
VVVVVAVESSFEDGLDGIAPSAARRGLHGGNEFGAGCEYALASLGDVAIFVALDVGSLVFCCSPAFEVFSVLLDSTLD